MKPKTAIQKGKELENFIVEKLRLGGLDRRAYRQKGSGSGRNKGDIWNDLNIHFECKNQKNFKGKEWFKQMKEENVGNLKECLVWHLPQTPLEDSKVIIDWWWFEELLAKSKEPPKISEPSRNLKYKLELLRKVDNEVIKELE